MFSLIEIYFKNLAHVIIEAGRSKIYSVGQANRLEIQGGVGVAVLSSNFAGQDAGNPRRVIMLDS